MAFRRTAERTRVLSAKRPAGRLVVANAFERGVGGGVWASRDPSQRFVATARSRVILGPLGGWDSWWRNAGLVAGPGVAIWVLHRCEVNGISSCLKRLQASDRVGTGYIAVCVGYRRRRHVIFVL
jgi:hypothetical protein